MQNRDRTVLEICGLSPPALMTTLVSFQGIQGHQRGHMENIIFNDIILNIVLKL